MIITNNKDLFTITIDHFIKIIKYVNDMNKFINLILPCTYYSCQITKKKLKIILIKAHVTLSLSITTCTCSLNSTEKS